jgi:hypothetical protein
MNNTCWISPEGKRYNILPYHHEEWIEDNLNNPEIEKLIPQVAKDFSEKAKASFLYVNMVLPKNGWIRIEGGEGVPTDVNIDVNVNYLGRLEKLFQDTLFVFKKAIIDIYDEVKRIGGITELVEEIRQEGLRRIMVMQRRMGLLESLRLMRKELMIEGIEETIDGINLYLNPDKEELFELPDNMRGFINREGDLRVWDDPYLFHKNACEKFNIDGEWFDGDQKFYGDRDFLLYYIPIIIVRKRIGYNVRFSSDWSSSVHNEETKKMIKNHKDIISMASSKNQNLNFNSLIEDLNKIYPTSVNEEQADEFSAQYYRGVSKEEGQRWLKGERISSKDLMPLDWEVVEYGIGDEAKSMTEKEVDDWVKSVCWWYDGSKKSIEGGLNLTSDFENAKGYAHDGFVLGIDADEVVEFSDAHHFLKDAKDAKLVFVYDIKKDKFISPNKKVK